MGMKDSMTSKIVCLFMLGSVLCGVVAKAAVDRTGSRFVKSQDIFINITSPYYSLLDDIFNVLSTSSWNVSSDCQNHTLKLLKLAQRGDVNALKFLDSTGKPSSGILTGGVFFIGYYSECVNTIIKDDTVSLSGKYCLVDFNFSGSAPEFIPEAIWLVLKRSPKSPTIGICLPSSCSDTDLSFALSESVHEIYTHKQTAKVSVCYTNEDGFSSDPVAKVILFVFSLLVAFSLVATVLDCIWTCAKRKQDEVTIAEDGNGSKVGSTEILCNTRVKEEKCKKIARQCILAFSLKTNGGKILTVGQESENMRCLHGLKFLSMSLIILGHTFFFGTQNLFIRNSGTLANVPKSFFLQLFSNGTFAVDTFYFVSGVLVAYVSLTTMKKTDGKINLGYFYLHRYFRLTPLMMAVIAFCAVLLRYVGSGPNWLADILMYDSWCRKNWWINALYLHNFINTQNMCLSHSWYLATDMQFHIIMPLILTFLYKKLTFGLTVIGTFMAVTVLTPGILIYLNDYPAIPYLNDAVSQSQTDAYFGSVYIKPYCRMGPFLIGVIIGYCFVYKKELHLKKIHVFILWISSIALGLFIIYIMWPAIQGHPPSRLEAAVYGALARPAWAVCLSWLTMACFYGYGGYANTLLSWSPLVPLSRLTYCAYLIHPVVMSVYNGCVETTVDFTQSSMIYLFLGNICVTYAISLVLSLLFESPFIGLEKAIRSSFKKKE